MTGREKEKTEKYRQSELERKSKKIQREEEKVSVRERNRDRDRGREGDTEKKTMLILTEINRDKRSQYRDLRQKKNWRYKLLLCVRVCVCEIRCDPIALVI